MVITCPNCDAKYSIDQSALKGKGARATCKSCKTVFPIYLEKPETKEEEQADSTLPSVEELDVFSLNFKEVGLKSWKVKIKMGLVYDFSDYKTLSKYIREGKVATTDNLSSDEGKTWTPLNEIEDLEKHFCEVYLRKKKEKLEGGVPDTEEKKSAPAKSTPSPSLGSGLSDLASVLAEAEAEVDGRPTPRNRPQPRSKPQPRMTSRNKKAVAKKEEPPPKKGNNVFVLLIAMLVVSGGVFFYLQQQEKVAKQERENFQDQQASKPTDQDKKENEARQKSLEEKMERLRRERAEKKEAEQKEQEKSKKPEVVQTAEEKEILARLAQQEQAKKNATDVMRDIQTAVRSQNWSTAEKLLRSIISSQPKPETKVLLGQVLFRRGKYVEARKFLQQSQGIPEAHKWLGYIAKEEGDDAGANQHFSVYLKSNPRDANQIKGVMNGN